ncbi:hypothetical protein KDA14_06165 [Candidatus Saccharibacteria bacterium]|nr:hypothetical protein [Candidatus Saccharibacteria bacterium]
MAHSAIEGLRAAMTHADGTPKYEKYVPEDPVKSMCIREVPEWVHEDYRMLKALCRKDEPELTINGLLVEALREYVGVAYAKRGKTYPRGEGA